MNLDKLARKLKRDLAANPKRAALLGLMLVVAGYFWAPLVSKWLGKSSPKARATGLVIRGDDLPIEQRASGKSQPRWDKVLAWMEADPRMASQKPAADLHPFGRPGSTKAQAAEAYAEQSAPPPTPPPLLDIAPQAVGIVLNGVLIGTKQKQATLNGETYCLGERIVAATKEGKDKLEFELVQVHREGVVLSRNSRRYELKLEQAKLAGRDKIERAGE